MLHILVHSPWQCDIDTLLHMLRDDDDLLLLQDGVLTAINNSKFIEIFKKASSTIFALEEDIKARGLIDKVSSKITIINYTDFINLIVKHTNQMNW